MPTALRSREGGSERLVTWQFAIVTITALVFFVYIGILVPIVPLFIEGPLGRGEFGIGLTIAAFSIAAIGARPMLGHIADRYGRRVLLVGGALIAGAAGMALGWVGAFWQLLPLRAIQGVGEAAVFVGAATLIADMSPPHRRAESASYFSVAVFGGIGVGPIIGEMLLDDGDFDRAFMVAGMFAMFAAAVALFAPSRIDMFDRDDEAEEALESALDDNGRRSFVHPAALMPGLVLASGVAAFATFGAFVPEYAREVGMAASGGLFTAYSLTTLSLRMVGATLPERLGARRAVTIGLGAFVIGLGALGLFPVIPALWIAAVFVGIGNAFNYPSLLALTIDRASDRDRAWAISSFTMFFEVGSVFGGIVLGGFAQLAGKQNGFLGGVALCIVGLYLLRAKLVPVGPSESGSLPPSADYVPVAGD